MGTPWRKKTLEEELRLLTIGEKMMLLDVGREVQKGLRLEKLAEVLECKRKVLQPIIVQLAQPIVSDTEFAFGFRKELHRKRVVSLFQSSCFDIWLERGGKWLVRHWDPSYCQRKHQVVDSYQLAEIILRHGDKTLWEFSSIDFAGDAEFLKGLALYYMFFLKIPNEFIKNVKKLVQEKEERLKIMFGRLDCLEDLIQSLDPFKNGQRGEITLPHFTIYGEHQRGVSNETSGYLCRNALAPFWEVVEARKEQGKDQTRYREEAGPLSLNSLEYFLQRMSWIFDEVEKSKRIKATEARSLFGQVTGRLPLTDEEWKILKGIAAKIKGIEVGGGEEQAPKTV